MALAREKWKRSRGVLVCCVLTYQLGEGCSRNFVRFVFLILYIRLVCTVWKSFGGFPPRCFLRILQKCEICSKLSFLGPSICWRARKPGKRMKAPASSPNNVTRQATQRQKRRRLLRIFLGLREIACCFFIEFDLFYTHVSKLLKSGLCKSLQGNNFQPGIMNTCRDVTSTQTCRSTSTNCWLDHSACNKLCIVGLS